jgi:UDP-GlcNAc:undecaprenyl-phosphate/decaprenyl-phosphate GlcNAc-1-phosphate transferase
MNIPLLPMVLAMLVTFFAIYLLRPFAISINLVDRPNNRKIHEQPVPLVGGIAMFIGVVVSLLLSPYNLNNFNYFLISSLIIVMIGVLDDHQDISALLRLLLQVLIAIIVVTAGGVNIESFGRLLGDHEVILIDSSYFISVIAIIAAMNAINMSDGIHGLAGGISLITFLSIVFLGIDRVSQESLLIVFIFCVILPVFLINNLCIGMSRDKRIFMGDAGSMFIGLSIAWSLINLSQGERQAFSPVTALWLFAIPLTEMTTVVLHRIAAGKSPFIADRFHSHHLLQLLGMSEKFILFLMLSLSLIMAVLGILGEKYLISEQNMFFCFLFFVCGYFISYRFTLKKVQHIKIE